ncbi:hypothetical protein NIES3787_02620 [Microcystis aeruginosa NIES-3787]|uniref:Uncharacterized protein n=1 Tax=Microcystis aeruginosa NIES-3787 TaxID=2517782 RepID=A0A6H9GDA5_MICAE|nr:hypothetical protein NIES3787_02620 [Microcystis aeruginosa NIES-3787]
MFLLVFSPETSYNDLRVKLEDFCRKPYLRKDFRILCSVAHWYYMALTQAL